MKKLKYLLILVLFVSLFYSVPISFAKFRAVKSLEGTIVVPENNYCLNNNINTLSDCMLAMDNYNTNINTAKSIISSKGTPDFSKIAPEVKYRQNGFVSETGTFNTVDYFMISDSYTFNPSAGTFSLVDASRVVIDENMESYVDKYTCADTNSSGCSSLYKIVTDTNDGTTYTITSYTKNTSSVYDVIDTDNGLYAANDDLGTSYYYRGNVKNNYVYFAHSYWRIVRRNGDGTVRLMFYNWGIDNGTYGDEYRINKKYYDPTFVGWMYNDDDFSTTEIESSDAIFNNYDSRTNYYFGKSYTYDSTTKLFYLSGTVENGDVIQTDWKTHYNDVLDGNYIYSCFSTDSLSTGCPVLMKINSRRSSSEINVHYLSYSSTSYSNAVKNEKASDIIDRLNSWYDSYIANETDNEGHSYAEYIADGIFCNDRSLSTEEDNGNGYSLSPTTHYASWERIINNHLPILTCPNNNDKFVLGGSSITSDAKKLTKAIGLLTADEVAMAGGSYDIDNSRFFMHYGENKYVWTSTPSFFSSWSRIASLWTLNKRGSLTNWYNVKDSGAIRPVVNVKASIKIYSGDGTIAAPYDLVIE